ncbi:MAG: hypothetical protein IPO02_10875 [Bacteroidetes bacterium]|nr:hypothetical protein [Bacteroidota bacterium]
MAVELEAIKDAWRWQVEASDVRLFNNSRHLTRVVMGAGGGGSRSVAFL